MGRHAPSPPARPALRPLERLRAIDAAWLLAVPCALAIVATTLLLGHPLSRVLFPPLSLRLVPWDREHLTPKPLEDTRYVIALCGPVALAAGTWALTRAHRYRRRRQTAAIVLAAQAIVVGIVVASFVGQHQKRWLFAYFNVRALVVAAALALAFALAAPRIRLAAGDSRRWRIVACAIALTATAAWLLPGVNSERSIAWAVNSHDSAFHLDETFAVLNGLAPLATFNAQYAALFPYVIALSMLGFGKTLLVFTVTVCALSVLALSAVYGILRRAARSPTLALGLFLPVLATSLFALNATSSRFSAATYFPMLPFRYGGPYLLGWLVARQLTRRSDARLWPLFAASGLVILNNFEFGVPAFGATVVAMLLTRGKPRARDVASLGASIALGLAVALAAVSALTLARAGMLPDVARMPQFSRLYGLAGYSVTPVRGLFGLPLVIYMTYVGAIVTAVVRALDHASNRVLTGMLAWSGVFGLGAASYFVARSDPTLMELMFGPWALTLALLVLVALESLRGRRRVSHILPAGAVLFGFGLAICSLAQFTAPWVQARRLQRPPHDAVVMDAAWARPPSRDPRVRRFVSSIADGSGRFVMRRGAPIALFLTTGHRIADAYGVVDVVPVTGPESIHTLAQFEEALDALRKAGGNTVLLEQERLERVVPTLTAHGFRIVTRTGVAVLPPIGEFAAPNVLVVDKLTKWVHLRDLRHA